MSIQNPSLGECIFRVIHNFPMPCQRFKKPNRLEEIPIGTSVFIVYRGERFAYQATIGPEAELEATEIGGWDAQHGLSTNPAPRIPKLVKPDYLTQERIKQEEIYISQ